MSSYLLFYLNKICLRASKNEALSGSVSSLIFGMQVRGKSSTSCEGF
jgi:hypothetical protein